MHNKSIRTIVILGIVSIVGIFSIQGYWLRINFLENKKEFDKKVAFALENVADAVVAYNNHELSVLNPVQKIKFNYYVVNVNDVINPVVLEHYLKTEFERADVKLDYKYAIYDCDAKEMINGKHVSDKGTKITDIGSNIFPIHEEHVYYFGLEFPNLMIFMIKSLSIWLVFALISIIALLFFGYAIFTIHQQNKLSKLQKDFINNMTHEFKTPISSIRLASEYLLTNDYIKTDERLKKYAELLKDQNERLNNQVENILQIARAEKSNFTIGKQSINLVETIQGVVDLYDLKYTDKIKIEIKYTEKELIINADEFHFTNVIHNIIDNSIKYCKENCEIKISAKEIKNGIELTFVDNGIGIPEKYHKKVFHKFYRVDTGNIHNVKGFGLGLYYVKTICEKHRWKINLKSKEKEGTEIVIHIN